MPVEEEFWRRSVWRGSEIDAGHVENPTAKPHLEKLPVSGMIDIVVEMRDGNTPLLKTWKVAGGESSCRQFDGKTCK